MHNHIALPPPRNLHFLTEKAGECLLSPEGTELYVSDSQGQVHLYTGPDWSKMTDGEISAWLAEHPLK